MFISINAAAKINLHLEIFGIRADGYHDLVSLMQMISLYDEIRIKTMSPGERDWINGGSSIPMRENTVFKAIQVFREKTGIREGVSVQLFKRIPVGAGLGGGSSDAAAVLTALDRIFETKLKRTEMNALGSLIGSDVPFFLHSAASIVMGRGELVTPVKPRTDFKLLLINSGFQIETSKAYGWFDSFSARHKAHPVEDRRMEIGEVYKKNGISEWNFSNSFLKVIESRYPEIKQARQTLKSMGAISTGLSGSGATFFGIFATRKEAERVSMHFRNLYPFVKVAEPLEMKPIPVLKSNNELLGNTG